MIRKNQNNYISPELEKMQEVVIDFRTRIYIPIGADAAEARKKYLEKHGGKAS